jgi:hypothetical protein
VADPDASIVGVDDVLREAGLEGDQPDQPPPDQARLAAPSKTEEPIKAKAQTAAEPSPGAKRTKSTANEAEASGIPDNTVLPSAGAFDDSLSSATASAGQQYVLKRQDVRVSLALRAPPGVPTEVITWTLPYPVLTHTVQASRCQPSCS